ncbi:hypothetical protein CN326_17355 [Bacillus sp. AFS018417]|uniref:IS66 family insertion sequence element accessory protein TnpA n=1 Tax=unclassified Bacillus (in: firmicutes) TaxID=185979 RepID=UPI000BF3017C|nr:MULTISPECIES: transposase domain-containing protein [unclassified Bacillus (in: firmicutes)]MCP1124292.1 transposase domain-containing protein [Bacillus sp. 3103sda1]PEZ03976.1 hypothetical protein CN326_17355 [Bacillus sp. AFS018417]
MKRHLLKKEWETYIQDYKNSELSKVAWYQKQNLPVYRLYYWLKKYSVVETAKENNLSSYHYLRYLFETLPNIDLNNKEDIDKVLPWSTDLPSRCRVPKKSEVNEK